MLIAEQLETKIRQNRLVDLSVDWADEIIFPYYEGLALNNITHSVADLFGTPLPDSNPLLSEVWQNQQPTDIDRVVVFLLDGVGYKHLNMLMAEDDSIKQAVNELNGGRDVIPLTSVAPSTTAVALPTLWTGGTPGETAMLGTVMFLREVHTLGDMLSFRPVKGRNFPDTFADWGMKSSDIVDMAGISEHLAKHKIETHLVTDRQYVGTGLSKILHRGVTNYQTHNAYSDMILRLEETLINTRGKRAYVGAYWSAVDTIAHSYGAHNRYTHTEIRTQLLALRDLLNNPEIQDGRTVFMLIADHGHYDAFNKINVNDDPVFRDSMILGLSGDARFAYMYLQPNSEARVKQHIDQNYADKLAYIPREKAIASGLLGNKLSTKTASRIGDYIIVPRLGWTLEDFTVMRLPLVSWHAGLSDWEMLVPFIWRQI